MALRAYGSDPARQLLGHVARLVYRHPDRQLLVQVVTQVKRLINRRAAARVVTRLVKVKAQAGDPLNEAADALASAAAGLDPTRSQGVDPEGVYIRYRGTLMPWNSRLKRELTQVAATQLAAKCDRPVIRRGVAAPRSVALTAPWPVATPVRPGQEDPGRGDGADAATPAKRQALQSLARMYGGHVPGKCALVQAESDATPRAPSAGTRRRRRRAYCACAGPSKGAD